MCTPTDAFLRGTPRAGRTAGSPRCWAPLQPRCRADVRRGRAQAVVPGRDAEAQPSAAGSSPSGVSPFGRRSGLPPPRAHRSLRSPSAAPDRAQAPLPAPGPAGGRRPGAAAALRFGASPAAPRRLRAEPRPPAGLHGTRSGHNAAGRDASRCPARGPPSPSPGAHPSPRGRGPSSPRSLRRSPREAAAARSLVPPGRAGDGRRAEGGRAGPGARPRGACAGLSCPLAGKGSGAAPPYSRRPAAPPRPAGLRPRPAPETPGQGTPPVTPPSRAVPVGGEGSRKIPPPRHGAQQAAPAPSAVLCLRSVLSLSGSRR